MKNIWDRKNLPVLGYVLLAMAVAFALYSDQEHNKDAREQIAAESMARDRAIRFEARRAKKETEAARLERVKMINRINKEQCDEIEKLKKDNRDAAREQYLQLDLNARLLGITVTPELRAKAKKDYLAKIKRNKKDTCPRQLIE